MRRAVCLHSYKEKCKMASEYQKELKRSSEEQGMSIFHFFDFRVLKVRLQRTLHSLNENYGKSRLVHLLSWNNRVSPIAQWKNWACAIKIPHVTYPVLPMTSSFGLAKRLILW